MNGDDRLDRAELARALRAAHGDLHAHMLAHEGPLAHTVAGSGPGSECCRLFEEAIEKHRENLLAFSRHQRERR